MYNSAYALLGGSITAQPNSPDNLAENLSLVRNGLPVEMVDKGMQLLGVNKTEYARLIGVNVRSLQRKSKDDDARLSPMSSEHVLLLADMLNNSINYFGERDKALAWLDRKNIALGDVTPLSICDTVAGINMVNETLNKLKYGFTA